MPHLDINIARLQRAHSELKRNLKDIELCILSTPTGPAREHLTEANIHMMAALSKLESADSVLCDNYNEAKGKK